MKKNDYSKLLQTLVQELDYFQKLLIFSERSKVDKGLKELNLDQIIGAIQKVMTMVREVKEMKKLTLIDKDFTNFCFLLIHGSDMADYLLTLEESSEKVRWHAHSWKKIAGTFKPFLE